MGSSAARQRSSKVRELEAGTWPTQMKNRVQFWTTQVDQQLGLFTTGCDGACDMQFRIRVPDVFKWSLFQTGINSEASSTPCLLCITKLYYTLIWLFGQDCSLAGSSSLPNYCFFLIAQRGTCFSPPTEPHFLCTPPHITHLLPISPDPWTTMTQPCVWRRIALYSIGLAPSS